MKFLPPSNPIPPVHNHILPNFSLCLFKYTCVCVCVCVYVCVFNLGDYFLFS